MCLKLFVLLHLFLLTACTTLLPFTPFQLAVSFHPQISISSMLAPGLRSNNRVGGVDLVKRREIALLFVSALGREEPGLWRHVVLSRCVRACGRQRHHHTGSGASAG